MTEEVTNYELIEHFATGGMAEIWLADRFDKDGSRERVVVKRIKSERTDDADFETMFLDEARISLELTHPNIVQCLELGRMDGQWFVAMEWIDGKTLERIFDEHQAEGRTIEPAVLCRVMSETLTALHFAHTYTDAGGTTWDIVHRDVTPSNILIARSGIAKLTDFGIAKAAGRQTRTQTGAVKGKFAYMAPEQIASSDVDGRTDVFAAGLLLYEALSGSHPFGGGLQAVHGIVQNDAPPLTGVAPELAAVVDRALQKEPEDRWQSALAMRDALDEAARSAGLVATSQDVAAAVDPPLLETAVQAAVTPATLDAPPVITPAMIRPPPPRPHGNGRLIAAAATMVALVFLAAVVALIALSNRGSEPPPSATTEVIEPGANEGAVGRETTGEREDDREETKEQKKQRERAEKEEKKRREHAEKEAKKARKKQHNKRKRERKKKRDKDDDDD